MRVFVTGAGGSFARALLPVLCEHAAIEAVTAVDAHPQRYAHPRLRAVGLDFVDTAITGMLAGHDALVHLPERAISHGGAPQTGGFDAAVRPAHKLFHAAHAAGVTRLIHMSTAAVYGTAVHAGEQSPLRPLPGFAYAAQQAHLERLLEIDLPHCVRLRPHLIVGAHAHPAVKRLLRQPFYPRRPDPQPLFQCVHEDDLAAAVLLCLTADARGAYNIATEDSYSLRDVIRMRHVLSAGLGPSAARAACAIGSHLFRLDIDAAAWLERISHTLLVNCRRAIVELGWRRRYSAQQALAAT